MPLAYLINQYPKVSHTFIRREILALERLGVPVQRVALRGWDATLVDPLDEAERERTQYVLRAGLLTLLLAVIAVFASAPARFMEALALALRVGWKAERPWPYHMVYLAEACHVVRLLRQAKVGHLHAHFSTNSTEVAMLARALGGPPYSFSVHGTDDFDNPLLLSMREKVRRAAFVVAASSYARAQILRWADQRDWRKVHVVHCGLDASSFDASDPAPAGDAGRLVCVGRLCREKGQLLLLDAVHAMVRRGRRVQLVLAGDGELRAEIERRIVENGLEQWVRVTGWISNERVREEIIAARALVLPSFAEGLPVVIMEAMALRRPVLSTFVAGIPELVQNGQSGWLVPAGDVEALVAAMEDCLSRPVEELAAMGEAARRRVKERHLIDNEAAKLAALFHGR